jgi:hypothetical protein
MTAVSFCVPSIDELATGAGGGEGEAADADTISSLLWLACGSSPTVRPSKAKRLLTSSGRGKWTSMTLPSTWFVACSIVCFEKPEEEHRMARILVEVKATLPVGSAER